ncbi:MAG: ATP-binding protein [Myxococcales bacterium]|nr:ATP-binding protein [Myxococcales bacterium]
MKPSSTLRFRRTTAAVALLWAVSAVVLSMGPLRVPPGGVQHPMRVSVLGGYAIVEGLGPSLAAAGTEVEPGDRLLEVNGRQFLVEYRRGPGWLEAGVRNTYLFEKRDGRRFRVDLLPESMQAMTTRLMVLMHALLLLVAVIYIATGGVVWWLRRDRPGAWALLLFCSTMSVQLAHTMEGDSIRWSWQCLTVNLPLIGATTFYLFTTYPIEPGWIVRHRRIQLLPFGAAFLLGGVGLLEGPLGLPVGSVLTASFFFTLAAIVASVGILGVERRRHAGSVLKDRADVMFFGAIVSFVPVALVFLAQWWLQEPFPYYFTLLWVFVFPMAVGYGLLKKQLFGIRAVAKSSAAYGAASLAIVAMFAFLITFTDTLVWRLGVSFRWFQVVFLFFAILAFDPLRRRTQNLVDRFFDRDRAAYRVAVREISEAMVSMLSLNEIADRILVALTDTMGVERAMVLIVDDERKLLRPIASRGDWDDHALHTEIPSDHPIWKHLWMRREDLSRVDFDDEPDLENREACRDVFDTLEVEIVVPILYGVDLLGVIAVGRKLSGDRPAPDDRLLLRTLANQSSIAIENAKAFDEIAKLNETLEARVEERTRELRETQAQLMQAEKMKSLGQLVAGVAHELNNPIGFVHANLQLLDEQVRKLLEGQRTDSDREHVRAAITKLLARSREGTQRVKKIVEDLRTFSRMDQAELQDADIHEEIDRTLALMEPRFKNRITVLRDYGDLPRVRCYAGQLNQVFLNLLTNACDAVEEGGEIRITTHRTDGGVRLEFHDDGTGIPGDIQSRIFDPFFTTKPVGAGTGLGLSLSHGIVERHGGHIFVASEPGRGTTFVIDLPLVAAEN